MDGAIVGVFALMLIVGLVCGAHPFLTGDTDVWSNYLKVAHGDGVFYQLGFSYVSLMAHIGDVVLRDGSQVNLASDLGNFGTAIFKVIEWFVGFVIVMVKSFIEGILSLANRGAVI